MWQDHVGRGLAKVAGSEGHAGAASSADVDEAEDPTSIFELKLTNYVNVKSFLLQVCF